MRERRHVVWDWNGTLLNDVEVVLAATNELFAPFGVTLTMAEYQQSFRRPLADFYAEALGREITEEEFLRFDDVFHDAYVKRIDVVNLSQGAKGALDALESEGNTQSLLSLWRHHHLVPLVAALGLESKFVRVDGRQTLGIDGKTQPLARHLEALGLRGEQVCLVGDSLDDAYAARANGASCILYGRTHTRKALEETGFPVASSLLNAVELCTSL